jgi:bifunctional non-homologous end joining protein LigD
LIERKKILDEFLEKSPEGVTVSKYVIGNGEECFKAACKLNLEGVVGKKLTSTYSSKRNGDWIKLKCENRQEFAIVGYTRTQKKTTGVSALLLAVYDKGKFTYIGRAGSGISIEEGIELEKKLKPLHSDECTVVNPPSLVKGENFFWVKPVLVAEVRYAEFTRDGIIRQASYKGLRIDKKSEEAVMEITSKTDKAKKENSDKDILSNIKITNPDKVLFSNPLVTKIDVVSYYAAVADRMLPYVKDRVLSIVRCPKGVGEPCFFKKHPDKEYKGVKHIMVPSDDGESEYFYITEKEGLVAEAQMGTIEFHTWGSGVDDIERPDIMVFDLDPDEKMNISRIAEGAKDLKAVLDKMGLISFIKTSGGKGYHIVVPFEKGADWEEFKNFAKTVAIYMESKWPDKYTSNMRKEKRKGRIFVDWVRNGRGATSIAPYSVRAREGAKVSMPIRWKELDSTMPDSYDIENSLIRIKKSDPWKDFFAIKQKLPQLRL